MEYHMNNTDKDPKVNVARELKTGVITEIDLEWIEVPEGDIDMTCVKCGHSSFIECGCDPEDENEDLPLNVKQFLKKEVEFLRDNKLCTLDCYKHTIHTDEENGLEYCENVVYARFNGKEYGVYADSPTEENEDHQELVWVTKDPEEAKAWIKLYNDLAWDAVVSKGKKDEMPEV
jgi:hypothetical protein